MFKISSVWEASANINEFVKETPVLYSEYLYNKLGFNCYLKAENLQETGSFKIRGASNAIKKIAKSNHLLTGLVAASSGNHGQAVACVANKLGIPAIIVMPKSAPKVKVDAVLRYGATVEYCGYTSSERITKAREINRENGYVEIPPFDHIDIITGQGTVGKEILEQIPDADIVIVPIGGGGLISGISATIKTLKPSTIIIGAEPEKSNSMYQSIKRGRITQLEKTESVADGLLSLRPGELTFSFVREYVDRLVLVEEAEIYKALELCINTYKVLPEPSGVVSLAAALKEDWGSNKKVICIISGGNCDMSIFFNMPSK